MVDNTESLSAMTVPNGTPGISAFGPPPPPSFEFRGPNNEPMVTIRPNGEVELAPGLDISEASRLFWQGLADAFPGWKASVLAAATQAPQGTPHGPPQGTHKPNACAKSAPHSARR